MEKVVKMENTAKENFQNKNACYYLVTDIRYGVKEKVRTGIEANPFTRRIAGDYRYRTVMFAVPGMAMNVIFALFNGAIGIYSRSAWYGTLSAYYILLSVMRFLALRYNRKMSKGKHSEGLLAEEGKRYPGFLIYAVAAYTFYKTIISMINLIKVWKYKSPLLMAIRDIGYIDACVSVLSLQTAMFAAFGEEQESFIKFMNGITGSVVYLLVLCIGIYSIRSADRMKRKLSDGTGRYRE